MAPAHLEHTHLASYLVLGLAATCIASDTVQGLIARNKLNRKWLVLYGVLCIFAYLYARPFIRVGIGSAKRGYINFSTLYIVWLCSAVFYHLPSLETLGVDVRADVSMLIVAFLASLAVLAMLVLVHTLAVSLSVLPRRVRLTAGTVGPGAGGSGGGGGGRHGTLRELWVVLLINSMIIAVACSTYHSFCGNGSLLVDGGTPALKAAVCAKWLHPILTSQYPRFSSWMLYGEGSSRDPASGAAADAEPPLSPDSGWNATRFIDTCSGCDSGSSNSSGAGSGSSWQAGYVSVDFPLDGRGAQAVPAGDVLSPVFTMWVTLVAVYVANVLAGQPGMLDDQMSGASLSGGSRHGSSNSLRGTRRSVDFGGRLSIGGVGPGTGSGGGGGMGRRAPSFRRISSSDRVASAGSGGSGGALAGTASGGGGGSARKGRHRTLEIKRPISKPTAAPPGARGAAAAVALAAARRSLTSLTRLAASTGKLKRAAADYVRSSHPYLPALLGKVREGMAALEPNHLAAELAEATGVPASLARELTRGSSFANVADAAIASGNASPPYQPSAYGGGGGAWAGSGGGGGGGVSGGGSGPLPYGVAGGRVEAYSVSGIEGDGAAAAQPQFLGMVPWWSGTSADLFKTLFDLMVSLKLFLGRFDMRTMQAATAASMADSFNDTPSEGDGFTYEHLEERRELWLDFMADTGDGGNPTYAVASALAAPVLQVTVPEDLPLPQPAPADPAPQAAKSQGQGQEQGQASGREPIIKPGGSLALPRADVLVIGGDLAYPNPSRDTYQQRLFRPFEDALPPPPHFHPGRLVVHKPDLPPAWGVQEAHLPGDLRGLSPRSSRAASSAALRRYSGPTAFAIPGNHDWIDGLETFTREVQHKGWLGGWLLPQEKSYFALRLPAGWWLFGFDLALVQDIDMQQYRYFANVVEQRMEPDDQVILITHEPLWLLEWFWQRRHGSNLRQLVRGHLRGRARLHLAGDIHFYMRHSWASAEQPPPPPPSSAAQEQGQATKEGPPATGASEQTGGSTEAAGAAVPKLLAAAPGGTGRSGYPSGPSVGRHSDGPPARSDASGTTACGSGPSDDMYYRSSGDTAQTSSGGVRFAQAFGPPALSAFAYPTPAAARGSSADGSVRGAPGGGSDIIGGSSDDDSDGGGGGGGGDGGCGASDWAMAKARGGGGGLYTRRLPPVGLGCDDHDNKASGRVGAPPPLTLPPLHTRPPAAAAAMAAAGPAVAHDAAASVPPPHPHRIAPAPPRHILMEGDAGGGGSAAGAVAHSGRPAVEPCAGCRARQAWARHPHDPEHLVVNGGGGAFLHPTHVFAGARFPAPEDPAAEATAGLYAAVMLPCTCRVYAPGGALYGGPPGGSITSNPASPPLAFARYPSPQPPPTTLGGAGGAGGAAGSGAWLGGGPGGSSRGSSINGGVGGAGGGGALGGVSGGSITGYAALGPDGEYVCRACYPSPRTSMQLGRNNLHVFRLRNSRFDVIGGAFYFLLVVSVLPRCSHLAEVLDADTPGRALSLLASAYLDTWGAILGRSYVSVAALGLMFMMSLGLAGGGGVGAGRPPVDGGKSGNGGAGGSGGGGGQPGVVSAPRPLFPARIGGFGLQLTFALAHTLTHVSLAIVLLLLLELGVETCIKYERLGVDGPHSLYRWYRAYEEKHFPDPMGLRAFLQRCTLGLYPRALQAAMSLYDVPELIAVARTAMCAAGGSLETISRLQAVTYYVGMLAYYWLLATPAMGFVFGLYLYLSVCWFHVHYDEAFSSLREPSCKSFCRLHIGPGGDLRLYTLALDEVPNRWREDPRWRSPNGGGCPGIPAHEAHYPSRWLPAKAEHGTAAAAKRAAGASPVLRRPSGSGRQDKTTAAAKASNGAPTAVGGGAMQGVVAAAGGMSGPIWRLVDFVHIPRKHV